MSHRYASSYHPLVLALLFGLAIMLIPASSVLGDNVGACPGSGTPSSSLKLGGRTITPTLILQASGGQPCPAGETMLGLVSLSRTLIVSPNGTPTENGSALLAARNIISNSNPSATNPWLLKLEPGNYDLDNQSLTLLPYVDLEGSGEDTTTISSTISSPGLPPTAATLVAASNSEVRSLKVANSGSNPYQVAVMITNSNIARFSHFTASTSSTGSSLAVGLANNGATLTLNNSTISVSSSGGSGYGIYTFGVNNIADSTIISSKGFANYAFNSAGGTSLISNSTITASGGSIFNYGIYSAGGVFTVTNSTLTASGSSQSIAFYSISGTPRVTNSQLYGGSSTSTGLTICPFSVNAVTFVPLTNGTC